MDLRRRSKNRVVEAIADEADLAVSVVIATLLPCPFMLPSEHASDCAMM
jgi:hypothetical protein